ncbi:MAG TPA: GNAT family N-acetyltransferase [Verrucomicrobiales bacterium]|nr:GNAT family N-acetyltransferase [Verrucomicrobiales bacterium]
MIESALERFPCDVESSDGFRCTLRTLQSNDEEQFREFFLAIPEDERLFLKHRVTERAVFHQWCQEIDCESNLSLLGCAENRIIADGTLHQRQGGWKRHIGLVSALVHPAYRGHGLVSILTKELIEIGTHCGLARLEAEFSGDRSSDIRAFTDAGFRELVRLPRYVRDIHGRPHDYVLLGLNLIPDEDLVAAAD